MLEWNAVGLGGMASGAVGWILAAVVWVAAPGRDANRRLATVLYLEGATGWTGGGLVFMTSDQSVAYAAQATAYVAFGAMIFVYLAFLATLPSPLTRPLRRRWIDALLGVSALAFIAFLLLRMDLFLPGMGPSPYSSYWPLNGPLTVPALIAPSILIFLFGLAAAISMWRFAPAGSLARRQGATYAIAFAIRDLAWIGFMVTAFVLHTGAFAPHAFNATLVVFQSILAFGMLRHQLFNLELQVKWTIPRGAAVGTLAAAFFVAKEGVEYLLRLEGLVPSVAGAALVAGLAYPVWKGATRFTERIMPGVQDSPDYRAARSREIYRAAVEELAGEGVSPRERRVLDALRAKLDITAPDARVIEKGVSQSAGMAE